MPKDNKFLNLCSEIGGNLSCLDESMAALNFLYDGLETESLHCGNFLEEWKCIVFIRRFPLYLSLFNVIYREKSAVWRTYITQLIKPLN